MSLGVPAPRPLSSQPAVIMHLAWCSPFLLLPAVMEKYVKNARFCLICNYVSKIVPAVQSRCTRFRFPPLKAEHVQERLQHVVNNEK